MSSPSVDHDAVRAIVLYTIQRLNGPSPAELTEHFFPPSPLGFEKTDLRTVLSDLLYSGAVVMEADRRLRVAEKTPTSHERGGEEGDPAPVHEKVPIESVTTLRVWDSQNRSQVTHLIRRFIDGGSSDTLCGLTRFPTRDRKGEVVRDPDLPGWSVEGGIWGCDIQQVECGECLAHLRIAPAD